MVHGGIAGLGSGYLGPVTDWGGGSLRFLDHAASHLGLERGIWPAQGASSSASTGQGLG